MALTEKQIEQIQSGILNIYSEIEFEIMRNIGKRLADTGEVTDTDKWRLDKIAENKALKKENAAIIAKYAKRTEEEIISLFQDMAIISLEDDEKTYKKAIEKGILKTQGPVTKNKAIQTTINKAIKEAQTFLNLTNTTALQSASAEFLSIVNTSYLQVDSGLYSLNTAVRRASLKLADKGITAQIYEREDGRLIQYNIDAALRREIHTSSLNTARAAQDERMEEYGVDTYEVSSHMGARPRCAIDQGKIFSRSGKKPYGKPETEGEAAGLFGINCSHQKYPHIPSISIQRNFPMNEKENEKAYQESQTQRYLENEVKKEKRRLIIMDNENDTEQFERTSVKLKSKEKALSDFMDKTGRQQTERVSVTGFTRSLSQKAIQANKKLTN